jgi:hypothetical protein
MTRTQEQQINLEVAHIRVKSDNDRARSIEEGMTVSKFCKAIYYSLEMNLYRRFFDPTVYTRYCLVREIQNVDPVQTGLIVGTTPTIEPIKNI